MNIRQATLILATISFFSVIISAPVQAADPIPADTQHVISLDGTWRFKLEQAPPPPRFLGVSGHPIPMVSPPTMEPFYRTDYREDASWHDLAVPGNWEMAGFSPATYYQPDNASGLYRLEFNVPEHWKGSIVKVNFDGVQNGCEVWCNGRPVPVDETSWGRTNYHESGWTAWQADLTSAVKFGQTNLLALRVTKNTKSVDCDTGDFFLLGGVYRPVTLFSEPTSHFSDISVRTKLLPDDKAEVSVIVQLAHAAKDSTVSMQIEGQPTVEGPPDATGQVTLTQLVSHPRLWSAEFPNLYTLSVDLKVSGGQVTEQWAHPIGIREVSIKHGIFYVNNVPVKLVGICRHDVYPTLGTAINADVWKKDLTLMKAANFNAIRTSHYPYGSGFYDLCDKMGFYVADEEPFCWIHGNDTNLAQPLAQRTRETVERDKNHPCVVIWAVGNEGKPGQDNDLAAKITREMDPTRPRLVSCRRADQGTTEVEFDDQHYVTPEQIHQAENSPRRARWPQIYLENPNVWDVRNGPDYGSLVLWAPVIARTWNELWNDEHVTGTFLWEWQDRAVADKCPTKYYYYYPKTGIQLVKVKGVVDGFRNPRPEYYDIKMAQTPVAIGDEPEILPDGVVLDVTNRYSFTDLNVLKAKWMLSEKSQTLSSSATHLELQPLSHGQVRLTLPTDALARADTLRLDFDHPGGWNVVTYQFFLKPVAHPAPRVKPVTGVKFPRFNLVTGERVRDGMGWWRLDRKTGELTHLKVQRTGAPTAAMDEATLTATPLMDVHSLDADVVLQPSNNVVGHVHAELADGKMSYRFDWTGATSDIYELGWIFDAPKGLDHFSWNRKALWSYYPPHHIGRPNGTATPDSADVDLTKVDRPDAFDFNSTKFNCNWASLTDANDRGLCLIFPSDEREDVRGGFAPDGGCTLIVNRCYSPPRDISTNIAEDLYTTLKKNEQVAGSFQLNGVAP
jgi:beta-galactosidase